MKSQIKYEGNFSQIWKKWSKICRHHKRPRIAEVILNNKNKAGGIAILDFKIVITEITWECHKNRHVHHWNRIETQQLIHAATSLKSLADKQINLCRKDGKIRLCVLKYETQPLPYNSYKNQFIMYKESKSMA